MKKPKKTALYSTVLQILMIVKKSPKEVKNIKRAKRSKDACDEREGLSTLRPTAHSGALMGRAKELSSGQIRAGNRARFNDWL